jgi:hypothetical protein
MDIDVDWRADKLGKPPSNGDKDPKTLKKADGGTGERDSKVSRQAHTSGEKDPKVSKPSQAGDDQNKDQKAKPSTSAEATSEKEKASASKPDGDH